MATSTPDTSEIRRRGRQRLIGAVTIVLLLVVFVPMMLDPEPRQDRKEPAAVAIPSKDNAPALPVPANKAPDTAKAPDAAKTAPATIPPKPQLADTTKSSTPPRPPEGPKVEAPPVTPAKAEPPKADLSQVIAAKTAEPAKAAPAAAPASAAAPLKLEGFAVQVGAFRDDEKLRQAREKLAAAKITHFTERLPSSDLTRLRAGPYKTREEADRAAAAIKTAGLDGKVVPLP
jgi:DedD protein